MCEKTLSFLVSISLFQPKFERRVYIIISLLLVVLFLIISYQYSDFIVYYMPFMFLFFSFTSITELVFNKEKLEKYFLKVKSYKGFKSLVKLIFCYRFFFFIILFLGSIVHLVKSIGT